MRKLITFLIGVVYFAVALPVSAQTPKRTDKYYIHDFSSEILIQKDKSLGVTETITAYFPFAKHGIFRTIPYKYDSNGKTLITRISIESVTDEIGKARQFSLSRSNGELEVKIGNPDFTVTGFQTYVIRYEVRNVLYQVNGAPELYWNSFGDNWDTDILNGEVLVKSPYAEVEDLTCWAGVKGTTQQECQFDKLSDSEVKFKATKPMGEGRDLSIVLALNANNDFAAADIWQKIANFLFEYGGFILAPLPFVLALVLWLNRGRDLKFVGDNPYYEPKKKTIKRVGLFARPALPMVYYPLDGLTPAQIGVIFDERVDMKDLVAEILELARLKYLKIKKTKKKGLLGSSDDYELTRLKKADDRLLDYQKLLLNKLFESGDKVRISQLKNKFYKHLGKFKTMLYRNMKEERFFRGNPNVVRAVWIVLFALTCVFNMALVVYLAQFSSFEMAQILLAVFLSLPMIFLGLAMPSRTPRGYQLYRQTKGLKFFTSKGKWRYEVAEKKLFIEEMLPLAVALGVVDKLAADMKELGIKPPDYLNGFAVANLNTSLKGFESTASKALASAPGGSGGGGFGGGSAGGGFGGGGGGSW